MANITPLYMSVSDAQIRYGICHSSLYELFQLEDCPKLKKFGRKTLIPVAEFDKFFEAHLDVSA